MTELYVLEAGLLLGLYVLLAGGWGVLYAVARLYNMASFRVAAAAVFGLHGLAAFAVIMRTPLDVGWKCLILASSLVFLAIPPIAWRFLQRIHADEKVGNVIGNLLNVLIGLGLAYSVIFATPAGAMSNTWLAISGIAVIVFSAWVRRTDPAWQSATNLVLGAALLLEAAARWAVEVAPLVSFWSVLLIGIAIAIVALWSILYRPETGRSAAPL